MTIAVFVAKGNDEFLEYSGDLLVTNSGIVDNQCGIEDSQLERPGVKTH